MIIPLIALLLMMVFSVQTHERKDYSCGNYAVLHLYSCKAVAAAQYLVHDDSNYQNITSAY